MTKDYALEMVSGPLTYNDITSTSPEGRRDMWTGRAGETGRRPRFLTKVRRSLTCCNGWSLAVSGQRGWGMGPGRGRL